MAACRRVYDSRHLQADCKEPGSAPEPHAWQSSMGYLVISGTREDASPTSPSADRAQPLLFVNNALANCRCCAARIRRVNRRDTAALTEPRCLRTVWTSSAASSDVRSLKSSRADDGCSRCARDVTWWALFDTVCDWRRWIVANSWSAQIHSFTSRQML